MKTDSEVQLKFDSQRAYHHITQLAFPRGCGSRGESQARDYIVRQFAAYGLRLEQESFSFTRFPAEIFPRLIFAGVTGIVIIVCWLNPSQPIFASILCLSSLFIALALTHWPKKLEWGFFKKVKYGGGDNLTLFSRQTPPVSVQNAEKHLCSSEIRYG